MKVPIGTLAITIVLLASGWAANSESDNWSGKWRGYITERGRSTLVELTLQDQPDRTEGQFTVLDKMGEDVEQGMSFAIQQVERSGRNLRFIVPLTGTIDEDAVSFDLVLEGNCLNGHGKELREGSARLSVTFVRHEP
jgi:hypothetical protein